MAAPLTPHQIVAQAGVALADIKARIAHTMAQIDPTDHADGLRRLRVAQLQARELLTRLEIAELEFAAAREPQKPCKEQAA